MNNRYNVVFIVYTFEDTIAIIPPKLAGKLVKKKPPAHGANQIAGFGEFRPLTNFEKKNHL